MHLNVVSRHNYNYKPPSALNNCCLNADFLQKCKQTEDLYFSFNYSYPF